MKYYVKNVEANVIVAEYEADAWVLPSTIDAAYNSPNFITLDENMVAVHTQPTVKRWSAFDFLRRFTPQERVSIRGIAKTDLVVEDFIAMLDKAENVYNTDPDTMAAMGYLVSINQISESRRAEILGE